MSDPFSWWSFLVSQDFQSHPFLLLHTITLNGPTQGHPSLFSLVRLPSGLGNITLRYGRKREHEERGQRGRKRTGDKLREIVRRREAGTNWSWSRKGHDVGSSHPLPLEAKAAFFFFLSLCLSLPFLPLLPPFFRSIPFCGTKTNPKSIKLHQMLDSGARNGGALSYSSHVLFCVITNRKENEAKSCSLR